MSYAYGGMKFKSRKHFEKYLEVYYPDVTEKEFEEYILETIIDGRVTTGTVARMLSPFIQSWFDKKR